MCKRKKNWFGDESKCQLINVVVTSYTKLSPFLHFKSLVLNILLGFTTLTMLYNLLLATNNFRNLLRKQKIL
jgi:hypothetical protein